MSGRELPAGWVEVPLAEIANSQLGKMLDKAKRTAGTSLPYLRNVNVRWGEIDLSDLLEMPFTADELDHFGLCDGDVLICEGGEPGRAAIWRGGNTPIKFQKALHRVRLQGGCDPRWLTFHLRKDAAAGGLSNYFTGTTIKHFTGEALRRYRVALPPLPEQRRIVEKIEALTARSRRAREALDTLPALIDRYRQSILAAAFRGDLTADWRAETIGADVEGELRHLAEKRSARWSEFGRGPCRAPLPVEESLPVPSDWAVTTMDALLVGIQSGKNFRCEERPPVEGEAGVIKISAVTWGKFDQDESKTVTDRALLDPDARIAEGDFLFSRANTIELVGACVIVDKFDKELYLTDKVLRFIFASDDVKRWVLWFLRSPQGRRQIEARSSGNQMSMRNIGQDSIRRLSIPLPSKAEIAAILAVLERRLAAIESLKRMAAEQRGRLATLDQSILAKAFRGELVPQDPNEPASVLLERIRAERAAAGPAPRRGRRPKEAGGG